MAYEFYSACTNDFMNRVLMEFNNFINNTYSNRHSLYSHQRDACDDVVQVDSYLRGISQVSILVTSKREYF